LSLNYWVVMKLYRSGSFTRQRLLMIQKIVFIRF